MRQSPLRHPFSLANPAILLFLLLASCAPAQPSDPISIVQAAYDRLNEGDVDGFMELVSEDAVFIDAGGGRHVGHQAIREAYGSGDGPAANRVELSDFSADGNIVTYTIKEYLGKALMGEGRAVGVLADGNIIFDGLETWRSYYCDQDPSQAFCEGS